MNQKAFVVLLLTACHGRNRFLELLLSGNCISVVSQDLLVTFIACACLPGPLVRHAFQVSFDLQ